MEKLSPVSLSDINLQQDKNPSRQWYELKVYTLKNQVQQKLVEDYYRQVAIPMLNRLGSKNIGVFTEMDPEEQTKIYVLIPYSSMEDFISIREKLNEDITGSAYWDAPAAAPAYERIESSLLRAFTGMPTLQVPEQGPRIFELRRYESAGEKAGQQKIAMFNTGGELAVFNKVGFAPVFFGETLVGQLCPNLIYLLAYRDRAERSRRWEQFANDPAWKKLRAVPEYADEKIVSRISSVFLVPAAFSQI